MIPPGKARLVPLRWLTAAVLFGAVAAACASEPEADEPEAQAELLGGATTVFDVSSNAFSFPARNLDHPGRDAFSLGNHMFRRKWVTAPSSTTGDDGLGPTFNATSCDQCHLRDGRGAPPEKPGEEFDGILVRLSVPGQSEHGGPLGDPSYGDQLNPHGILGVPGEGTPSVTYEEVPGTYADGEAYSLRRPTYAFADLAFGPFAAGIMFSPRTAQAMIGLGLLEAIPEASILAIADENDRDGDGVSGRPNLVWNQRANRATLGRFGWKANQPTVEQQVAGAFLGDIGMTTSLDTVENCPAAQEACSAAPNGGVPELSDQKLDAVVRYSMTLAVPGRRNWKDATVRRGEKLFAEARCTACHVPKWQTGAVDGYASISNQTIRPYTDLLLHDMGPDLADGRPDFLADGTEWRTAPLWGVGLLPNVSKHTYLLHDGRARGYAEAILWHGGEAEASREAFRAMTKADREALLAFLQDL